MKEEEPNRCWNCGAIVDLDENGWGICVKCGKMTIGYSSGLLDLAIREVRTVVKGLIVKARTQVSRDEYQRTRDLTAHD